MEKDKARGIAKFYIYVHRKYVQIMKRR